MTSSGAMGPRRVRARRKPELVERWGLEAATKYDRAATLYTVGGLGSVTMLLMFLAGKVSGLHVVAVGALLIAFFALVPAMLVASILMFSVTKQICRRYGIDPRSKPPLSLQALKSPGRFDGWLAAHGRQPPAARPFGAR